MTKPRRHIKGQVAMLTRRCADRRFFLRPDNYINHVVSFEVGKNAEKYGQHVSAAMAMSNHAHLAVGDTTGDRSDFMRDAMSGIACSRNRDLNREGHFWGSGSYNDTVLLDRDAIERKLLYIWLNPVRAGLVESAAEWPGFKILPGDWGKKMRIDKPERFYGRRNPDVIEFTPQPPPGFEDMELEEVREHFQKLLWREEAKIVAERNDVGVPFAGADAILSRSPSARPALDEIEYILDTEPRFATQDQALMNRVRQNYRNFLDEYESRRQEWRDGIKRRVTFPCGTVQLKRCAPIKCDKIPPDEPGLFAAG